ncbi:MORN motif containing protein, putative [Babesia caballi]|uniref:MORN motif containing protein, putative n=1 Tax=Babesia caballi TaxID=5871 RepID=A0AAV4LUL9_BABCB|nr:MORN motif containing protein, putative [Babesia caballi]
MGQAQSVSSSSFQEEYYLFFDEKPQADRKDVASKQHTYSRRGSDGDASCAAAASEVSGLPRQVHRGNSFDVLTDSTRSDISHDGDVCDSGRTASLYNESEDIHSHLPPVEEGYVGHEPVLHEYKSPSGRYICGHYEGGVFTDGHITWPDGREYVGSLKGSVPHGFGTYRTSTGREYTGHWSLGLQHGTGCYVTEKHGCRIQRRGIWEHGQLVCWLDGDDISRVVDRSARAALLDEIMAASPTSSALSPSSYAASSVPSPAATPLARTHAPGACSGQDPGHYAALALVRNDRQRQLLEAQLQQPRRVAAERAHHGVHKVLDAVLHRCAAPAGEHAKHLLDALGQVLRDDREQPRHRSVRLQQGDPELEDALRLPHVEAHDARRHDVAERGLVVEALGRVLDEPRLEAEKVLHQLLGVLAQLRARVLVGQHVERGLGEHEVELLHLGQLRLAGRKQRVEPLHRVQIGAEEALLRHAAHGDNHLVGGRGEPRPDAARRVLQAPANLLHGDGLLAVLLQEPAHERRDALQDDLVEDVLHFDVPHQRADLGDQLAHLHRRHGHLPPDDGLELLEPHLRHLLDDGANGVRRQVADRVGRPLDQHHREGVVLPRALDAEPQALEHRLPLAQPPQVDVVAHRRDARHQRAFDLRRVRRAAPQQGHVHVAEQPHDQLHYHLGFVQQQHALGVPQKLDRGLPAVQLHQPRWYVPAQQVLDALNDRENRRHVLARRPPHVQRRHRRPQRPEARVQPLVRRREAPAVDCELLHRLEEPVAPQHLRQLRQRLVHLRDVALVLVVVRLARECGPRRDQQDDFHQLVADFLRPLAHRVAHRHPVVVLGEAVDGAGLVRGAEPGKDQAVGQLHEAHRQHQQPAQLGLRLDEAEIQRVDERDHQIAEAPQQKAVVAVERLHQEVVELVGHAQVKARPHHLLQVALRLLEVLHRVARRLRLLPDAVRQVGHLVQHVAHAVHRRLVRAVVNPVLHSRVRPADDLQAVVDEDFARLRVAREVVQPPPAVPAPEDGAGDLHVVHRGPQLDQQPQQLAVVRLHVLRHLVPDVRRHDDPRVGGLLGQALNEGQQRLEGERAPAVACDEVI